MSAHKEILQYMFIGHCTCLGIKMLDIMFLAENAIISFVKQVFFIGFSYSLVEYPLLFIGFLLVFLMCLFTPLGKRLGFIGEYENLDEALLGANVNINIDSNTIFPVVALML